MKKIVALLALTLVVVAALRAQNSFKVISFFTAKEDQAHISFVRDANRWFHQAAKENHFIYDSTGNWDNLNEIFLAKYDVVLFLDSRPEKQDQREAFQKFIERGGGWMGFHFAAFALTPSAFNQDWNWYHNSFLGAGSYKSNTWRPTPAILRVETGKHPATKKLPDTFKSAANEWYRWENDLTKNPDIQILVSIDSSSFPLGTGPKQHEIWYSGYYPVVWTNKKYNMIYINMGHDDIDYEHGTNKSLSSSFASKEQNRLVLNALFALGKKAKGTKK